MKERIKFIMEEQNLTPTRFADMLQINRAIISHILNGRNNPSLDVISKILSEMPFINAEWLINGIGEMYKPDYESDTQYNKRDLFNLEENSLDEQNKIKERKHNELTRLEKNSTQHAEKDINSQFLVGTKKIRQIIIYYEDSTFETFVSSISK